MTAINLPNITAAVVTQTHNNDIRNALRGTVYGMNSSTGAVQAGQDQGDVTTPYGTIYATGLNIDGQPINFSSTTSSANRIVSGQAMTASAAPDFIRSDGATNAADILGTATNLIVTINGVEVTVATDITLSSLTVAPSTNNTASINDSTYADQDWTKYIGEYGDTLPITSAGSEITSRVGQFAAFKLSTEYFIGYIKSATEIVNCYRGYFLDSAGSPVVREVLTNSDTVTLMNLGWVFVDNSGTTGDVAYTTPVWSGVEPASPATGDYWFDIANNDWKRYDGADFVTIDRTLIGLVVLDSTNCVASRSFDFDVSFTPLLNFDIELASVTQVQMKQKQGQVNVYGTNINYQYNQLVWDITTDLATGLTEASSTVYYCYITENGEPKIDVEKPYIKRDIRYIGQDDKTKVMYHPYESWRYVGHFYNDSSSDITIATSVELNQKSRVLLQEQDIPSASSQAEVKNLDYYNFFNSYNGDYEEYELVLERIVGSTSATLYMQVSNDNGATYIAGAGYFSAPVGTTLVVGQAQVTIATAISSTTESFSKVSLFDLVNPDIPMRFKSFARYNASGVAGLTEYNGGHALTGGALPPNDAFRIYLSTGTLTSGKLKLYGIRKEI